MIAFYRPPATCIQEFAVVRRPGKHETLWSALRHDGKRWITIGSWFTREAAEEAIRDYVRQKHNNRA